MRKRKNKNRKFLTIIGVVLLAVVACGYCFFFAGMSSTGETQYVYVDNDDNIDSVYTKLSGVSSGSSMIGFKTLVKMSGYADNVRTGRYAVREGEGAFMVFRHLKNGLQTPVSLVVPSVRTMDRLAAELSKRLMMDSTALYKALTDETVCQKYGYDTTTIAALFIPNTYDIYWNVSVEKLLDRMQKENKAFWNAERTRKAQAMKLTPIEVTTLASIVDEETANNGEKPMVAGMYYNRLMLRKVSHGGKPCWWAWLAM